MGVINLRKGQRIDIGFKNLVIGLGWDPNRGTGYDFDLDASAIMITGKQKIPTEGFFVFYGNPDSPDKALHHTGDDPTGGNSLDGDDESIVVNLEAVDQAISEILIVVTIHDGLTRKQNFGQVRNSYIRIVDSVSAQEIAKYELGEDFSTETAVEFGRLYKRESIWRFEASGLGFREDLKFFLSKYYDGDIIC